MTTNIAALTKAQLIAHIEGLDAQVSDLAAANELLTGELSQPAPAASDIPSDLMVTGFLVSCTPAKRKDGSIIDGFFKFAVDTSVSYVTGKDANGDNVYGYVSHKTVWFNADQGLADELTQLLDANKYTKVRCWYRFATKAANVNDVKQLDYETKQPRVDANGIAKTKKALKYNPDLKGVQVDVITSKPAGGAVEQDSNDLF